MDKSPGIQGRRTIDEVAHNRAVQDQAEFHVDVENRVANLERRGGGPAIYAIKVYEDTEVVVVGNKAFQWPIPEDLDDAALIKVEAAVTTVSSSGDLLIQVAKVSKTGSDLGDTLSTRISIAAGSFNSNDNAPEEDTSPAVVDYSNNIVSEGQHLRIDMDSAGTGAKGLVLHLYFTPSPEFTMIIEGSKGDPGGVTAWKGAWATSTLYEMSEAVSVGGSSYAATQMHTSGASSEPGVGGSWQTYWTLLANKGDTGATGATGSTGATGPIGPGGGFGGGISIQYQFDATIGDADPGAGLLRLSSATQNASTVVRADLLDTLGTDWTAVLDSLDDSSNTVKGQLRLASLDLLDWLIFNVTAVATPSGYRNITVANIGSSSSSPFANGQEVFLEFTRTGDKGTPGGAGIVAVIDGGGLTITTGIKGFIEIPFACTITAARLFADQTGSIKIDIWKDTYANYPPTNADTITAANEPEIVAGVKDEDVTLTGWTTSVAAGDILVFNVDTVATIQFVTVALTVARS